MAATITAQHCRPKLRRSQVSLTSSCSGIRRPIRMWRCSQQVHKIHRPHYTKLDYGRWTAWWGSTDPNFPNDWNPGDGQLVTSMTRPLNVNSGDTVLAGYDLFLGNNHTAATASLAGGNVQTDISCPDGSSYTLQVPLPNQSYSIAAGDNNWYPSPNQKSSLVYQGSATATGCTGGVAKNSYLSALGQGPSFTFAGPGFLSTDTTDPVNVRFHCDVGGSTGAGGSWSPTVTVKYSPQ